jgi:hypothetical protein
MTFHSLNLHPNTPDTVNLIDGHFAIHDTIGMPSRTIQRILKDIANKARLNWPVSACAQTHLCCCSRAERHHHTRDLHRRLENDIHVILIGQIREAWLDPAITSRFIFQPFQSLLHKPLYPLIGMATAHANHGGNVGDRHSVSQE